MKYSIAIDGPAGAGKSTIAKKAAKELGFIYVDTGAMYRAIGLFMIRLNISPKDSEEIKKACQDIVISIEYQNGEQQVILNGENVTLLLRTEEVGNMASAAAQNSAVREKLVELQRKLAQTANVIMDGRDIGTKVLPEASIKIYLTASVDVRAKRRYEELAKKGVSCNLKEIEKDIIDRDHRDMTREVSPLCQAEDAFLLDSSEMSIEEVVQVIINKVEA